MLYPNGTTRRPKVSSPYGPRDPKIGVSSFHRGADLIGYSVIHAIAAGRVTFAGRMNNAAGNTIVIDHGKGVTSVYMHNKSHKVRSGARVDEGQAIAVMGSTGNASGNCNHLEIRLQGKSVEPLAYIAQRIGGAKDGNRTSRPTREIQRVVGAKQDGIYGPDTTAKVRAYQSRHGLTVDGIWGKLTDAKAFPPAKPAPAKPTGSSLIRAVQQKLKTSYPLYASRLAVDGIQGPKTTAAIKEFQRRSGLTADGIVGPRTRKALGV